jgi:hypothetical protein
MSEEAEDMDTKVKITDNGYQITIPISEAYENDVIRDFLDFLRVREIASKSKATNKDIEELAEEVNESYWQANKDRLLDEISD